MHDDRIQYNRNFNPEVEFVVFLENCLINCSDDIRLSVKKILKNSKNDVMYKYFSESIKKIIVEKDIVSLINYHILDWVHIFKSHVDRSVFCDFIENIQDLLKECILGSGRNYLVDIPLDVLLSLTKKMRYICNFFKSYSINIDFAFWLLNVYEYPIQNEINIINYIPKDIDAKKISEILNKTPSFFVKDIGVFEKNKNILKNILLSEKFKEYLKKKELIF